MFFDRRGAGFVAGGFVSGGLVSGDQGHDCADGEDGAHDGQRNGDGHFKPARGEHLERYKREHCAEAVVEIAKAIEQGSEGEVERP